MVTHGILKFFSLIAVMLLCSSCTRIALAIVYSPHTIMAKMGESRVDLYGKLIDQDGRPVVGAKFKYEISTYGLLIKPNYSRRVAISDKDGLFEVHARRCAILYINNIDCKGYEYSYQYAPDKKNITSLEYRSGYIGRLHSDKDNPLVWHLRRKDHEGYFLLEDGIYFQLGKDDGNGKEIRAYGRDFGQGMSYGPDGRSREGRKPNYPGEIFWDIEATGVADKEKGVWSITLKTNGEHSGIQQFDKLLYGAPTDGYAKELQLNVPFGKWIVDPATSSSDPNSPYNRADMPIRHFYARLREQGVYARLDVKKIISDESRLEISCHALINPYGDRSFEQLAFLLDKLTYSEWNGANRELNKRIHESTALRSNAKDNARQAMREQRLPERPPFEEWIRDGLAFW